jgi:hypothetical protein
MMTIGTTGRLGLNALLTARILPGELAMHWARHHVEEIGNLENFLPTLFARETGIYPAQRITESPFGIFLRPSFAANHWREHWSS